MKTYSLSNRIDATILRTNAWSHPLHDHAFFEIIQVLEGSGNHITNGSACPYSRDSVFLLIPGDTHSFEIEEPSIFFIVTFQKVFLKDKATTPKEAAMAIPDGFLEDIFRRFTTISKADIEDFSRECEERELLLASLKGIGAEVVGSKVHREELLRCLLRTVLIVLSRRISGPLDGSRASKSAHSPVQGIMDYIHQSIHEKHLLRNNSIARQCGLSPGYVGQFFKKSTGKTLKRYVLECKLNVAKYRLLASSDSLKSIADLLGFSDERHFAKLFKKVHGIPPSQLRRNRV